MWGGSRTTLGALLLAALLPAAGCGAAAESAEPAPQRCLDSWNADAGAQRFGRHVYNTHESHRAQVAVLTAAEENPNVPAGGACAVIFAIPESDIEYGAVGLVETKLGWASMQELARDDGEKLSAIQAAASGAVNAGLFPDGTLEAE
jgi:hypothetical protein